MERCKVENGLLTPCKAYFEIMLKDKDLPPMQQAYYLDYIYLSWCPCCGFDFRPHKPNK